MTTEAPAEPDPAQVPAPRLLPLIVPSAVVGVAGVLLGISLVAERLQDVLWETLPDAPRVGRHRGVLKLWRQGRARTPYRIAAQSPDEKARILRLQPEEQVTCVLHPCSIRALDGRDAHRHRSRGGPGGVESAEARGSGPGDRMKLHDDGTPIR